MTSDVPHFDSLALTPRLVADLRSDHAGETGAVAMYRGILAVTQNAGVREFATEHLRTEREHCAFFERWLPDRHKSRLIKVWYGAGWALGAVAALGGARMVFRTIAAVESFVQRHYDEQLAELAADHHSVLRAALQRFRDEEVAHRDDARGRLGPPGLAGRLWASCIGFGSALGVSAARRI